MYETKKRKRQHNDKRNYRQQHLNDRGAHSRWRPEEDPTLFIQAHEADLRRGAQAQELAESLEVVEYIDISNHELAQARPRVGRALIRWDAGSGPVANSFDREVEETISLGTTNVSKDKEVAPDESGIWVDRYDARLLLDALPRFESSLDPVLAHARPNSPSGWSDLPSDAEDTFFFSPEEAENYKNEKRRRLFEQAQEERVKARIDEEEEDAREAIDDDPWGGSDEEPDDTQKELMRRTAVHLVSSPNPAQLEMRILANHGADKRFAFLKGRWSRSWRLVKAKLRVEKQQKEREEKQEKEVKGLGVLAGYDSGSEDESESEVTQKVDSPEDEEKKELRRQKAKEWTVRRRNKDRSKEYQ
ncbi:hypothetical protein AGABI2DRAFT_188468 [Agaricus bisporus var. bisporus H97]|uniref:hypothetical protein n=1 Tax=Agaricus bisporus var. bisporus (strain H97 / ATCC MYA-4626 / FGSC 10389) TaxID=936046 RepID=UPI00029F5E5E|nr:hypothetical protein AGABI2DRAFT_188468 [Agaricus bisporus var. bisporus H97]EKV42886.1 hypothetical protein AGABI2DRAFT_188468 [Agaricus bisporus var. bisporus H97]